MQINVSKFKSEWKWKGGIKIVTSLPCGPVNCQSP